MRVVLHFRRLLGFCLLLAVAIVGCGASSPTQPGVLSAEITLGVNKTLAYQSTRGESLTLTEGQTLVYEWRDGTELVNGHIHRPHPPELPQTYELAFLQKHYGQVPMALAYVDSHAGDPTQAWNEAVRAWEKACWDQIVAVQLEYTRDFPRVGSRAAAQKTLESVLQSALVQSARLETVSHMPEHWNLLVVLKGSDEREVSLSPDLEPSYTGQAPVSYGEAQSMKRVLTRLLTEGDAHVRVELYGGGMNILIGKRALAKTGR